MKRRSVATLPLWLCHWCRKYEASTCKLSTNCWIWFPLDREISLSMIRGHLNSHRIEYIWKYSPLIRPPPTQTKPLEVESWNLALRFWGHWMDNTYEYYEYYVRLCTLIILKSWHVCKQIGLHTNNGNVSPFTADDSDIWKNKLEIRRKTKLSISSSLSLANWMVTTGMSLCV